MSDGEVLDFHIFIRENAVRLRQYAKRLCRFTLAEHDDVLNEAVADLGEQWELLRPADDDEAQRLCRRACVDAKSKLGRKARRDARREPATGLVSDLCTYDLMDIGAADSFSRIETGSLPALLMELSERQRQVVLVKTMDTKVTFDEVAELLDLSRGQVLRAYYSGRELLEQAMRRDERRYG